MQSRTVTLTAGTPATITLTGTRKNLELVHHGDDAAAVWFQVAAAIIPAWNPAYGANDLDVVLSGERVNTAAPIDCTVHLKSSGPVTITVLSNP